MITRTVNGGPDEGASSGRFGTPLSPHVGSGWYKNYGYPNDLTLCQNRPLSTEGPQAGTYPSYGGCGKLYYEAAKGFIDTEPDLFTFNFSGYSGKFFFDKNRKIHMIPESDVYIEPVNNPSYFYSWKVLTPDGTKYFFGGSAKEISTSDPAEYFGNKEVNSSTTWYLYRVESVNGESWINLNYVDDTYSFGNRSGQSVTFHEFSGPGGSNYGPGTITDPTSVTMASKILGTSIVDGKRLSQITTSSGYTTINFNPSAANRDDLTLYYKNGSTPIYNIESANTVSKSLDNIQLSIGAICKKFTFSYDYYIAANCSGCSGASWYGSNYDAKRLRLNWVQESSCSGTTIPKYEFTYNSTPIPRRYSLARDRWDYYNGIDANTGLIEQFTNPVAGVSMTYNTGSYRTVSETYNKAGILTRIKYPTGGTTDFNFECHRASSGSALVGGLRIKTITNSDDLGNTITKNFDYSTGKLYLDPTNYEYQYPNNNDNFTFANLGAMDFGITKLSNPTPPMWSSHGYHFGYEQASVNQNGNGVTTSNYMNISPAIINPSYAPLKPLVAAIGTGETLSEVVARNDGATLATTTYSRGLTGSTITTIDARKVQLMSCLNCGTPAEYGLWTDYSITTYRYNLTGKTEAKDGLTITTGYTYAASATHNNPIATEFTDSQGIVQRSETIYPTEAGASVPAAMYTLTDPNFKNMLGVPIEQKKLVGGVLTGRSVNQFTNTDGKVLLTKSTTYPIGTSEFEETNYEYDGSNNPSLFKKNDGVNVSYLWGYGGKYPVAAIKNATVVPIVSFTQSSGNTITANVSTATNAGSGSFTIQFPQPISISTSVYGNGGLTVSIQLINTTNSTTVFGPVSYTGLSNSASVTLPAGNYQYKYKVTGYTPPSFSGQTQSFTINTTYKRNNTRPTASYTSFEDTGTVDAQAKTGKKVLNGTYSVVMPSQLGTYLISYWQRQTAGSAWTYQEQTVTTTSAAPPNVVIGQIGYSIDEVRMYPKSAEMTTYTYEPGLGILTTTDTNNLTSYYEYDSFGRLVAIRDENQNILKTYKYNYKN